MKLLRVSAPLKLTNTSNWRLEEDEAEAIIRFGKDGDSEPLTKTSFPQSFIIFAFSTTLLTFPKRPEFLSLTLVWEQRSC